MSISERNTPSHGAMAMAMATPPHRQQRPPDVEEALSSMLWTPYERITPTVSSSDEDDDDERLNRKLRKSHSSYEQSTATCNTAPLIHPMPLAAPPPAAAAALAAAVALPVPFSHFSLSECGAFEAAKTSHRLSGGIQRNRFSYPSYYGSPAHTLTQWCSSAATAIKEPPSYESLYEASVSSVGAARASLARGQPNNLQCDRSQRSRVTTINTSDHNDLDDHDLDDDQLKLTANVPAERLVRSFTDDYISQNCALFTPAINDTETEREATTTASEQKQQQRAMETNARSQQSAENRSDSRTNCIINENNDKHEEVEGEVQNEDEVDDEQEIAITTYEETGVAVDAAVAAQVNQPVSCAPAATATAAAAAAALSRSRSHCVSERERSSVRAVAANPERAAATAAAESSIERAAPLRETAATAESGAAAAASGCGSELRSTSISLSSSFGACTSYSRSSISGSNYYTNNSNNILSSWLSRGRYNYNSCSSSANGSSSDALRPNKCLAELERLYAEFRASESLFEHRLSQAYDDVDDANDNNIDNNDIDNDKDTMRLNVAAELPPQPLPNVATTTAATQTGNNSSVFLKASSSNNNDSDNNNKKAKSISNIAILPAVAAAATKSCQRQPSLTIQVNNNNNNTNNGTINGNQVCVASPTSTTATVTTTTTAATATQESSIVNNNNGVCVVNCNYNSNNSASNTLNNNNNSIVAINNCVPASKVFSASVQNNLNNNPNVDVQHVAASASSSNNNNNNCNDTNMNVNVNVSSADNSVKVINVNATATSTPTPTPTTTLTTATTIIPPRTFTSTECQTDDLSNNNNNNSSSQQQLRTREQRRRERRERRQQQQQLQQQQQQQQQQMPPHHPRRHHMERPNPPLHPPPHLHHPHPHTHPAALGLARALLPDILHSHYPPPYSALPGGGGGPPPPLPPPPPAAPPQMPPMPPPQASGMPVPLLTPVISTVPLPGAAPLMSDGRFTLPLPIMRRSPSERSGKGCCGQWFAGPPLRALIAVVALGGVACALGGAALGATGLAGPPNSHLTAALLMIGVGVVLVTVSGAAWRMTAPGGQSCLGLGTTVDLARCGRRPCTRGGGAPHGLLYPEFQHRPPPPSYQASMQEYRLRLLLLDRDRQNGVVRGNSPPPTYRSHAGSLLRAPLTTIRSGMGGGGGGTISSSMGGSEYSLPPSYRSRNATPASLTLNSERTIETAPSGRLLANEDLPEPSAEQLPDYSALQSNTLLTSAIVEIESRNRSQESVASSPKAKDLVTIVTISQANSVQPAGSIQSQSQSQSQSKSQSQSQLQSQVQSQSTGQASALDQIDILAHL